MEIERVKPEFCGEGIIIPDHYIFRVQSGPHRYYGLSLNEEMSAPRYAPGVTSILHETMPTPYGLTKWREQNGEFYCNWFMESSALYGTWLHIVYGQLMRGQTIQFAKESLMAEFALFVQQKGEDWKSVQRWVKTEGRNPQKDIYGFIQWYKTHEVKPLAMEYPLFYDLIGGDMRPYAGSIDLVCELTYKKERVIAIVDFKTGYNVYESHAVQLQAYQDAWNLLKCGPEVTETFNVTSKDFNIPLGKTSLPYSMRRQSDNKAGELWPLYLDMFYAKHPAIQLPAVQFKSDAVKIDTEEFIEEVTA